SLEDEEAEGRVTLDSLLEVLNQQAVESDDAYDEVYLTEQKWDISKRGSVEKNVILLANRTKGYCQKSMGKANIAGGQDFSQRMLRSSRSNRSGTFLYEI
ncbi:hypothetical protein OSTOST_03622, partial [Ostertagia ostertagi]